MSCAKETIGPEQASLFGLHIVWYPNYIVPGCRVKRRPELSAQMADRGV